MSSRAAAMALSALAVVWATGCSGSGSGSSGTTSTGGSLGSIGSGTGSGSTGASTNAGSTSGSTQATGASTSSGSVNTSGTTTPAGTSSGTTTPAGSSSGMVAGSTGSTGSISITPNAEFAGPGATYRDGGLDPNAEIIFLAQVVGSPPTSCPPADGGGHIDATSLVEIGLASPGGVGPGTYTVVPFTDQLGNYADGGVNPNPSAEVIVGYPDGGAEAFGVGGTLVLTQADTSMVTGTVDATLVSPQGAASTLSLDFSATYCANIGH